MYYSLFGRCCNPRSRTCNSSPHPFNRQTNNSGRSTPPRKNGCPPFSAETCREENLLIKSTSLGGFILPEGTEKRATFHVASLNLDTSKLNHFIVQLVFSCNIIANGLKVRLRFQMFKQERIQCFPVPVSAGILYYRDKESTEANSFTLSACDCDSLPGTCCTYSALIEVEDMEAGGSLLIANPVLMATIAKND